MVDEKFEKNVREGRKVVSTHGVKDRINKKLSETNKNFEDDKFAVKTIRAARKQKHNKNKSYKNNR
jgi:hypothetical protein